MCPAPPGRLRLGGGRLHHLQLQDLSPALEGLGFKVVPFKVGVWGRVWGLGLFLLRLGLGVSEPNLERLGKGLGFRGSFEVGV